MFGDPALGTSSVINLHGLAWDQPADLSSRAAQGKLSPVAIRAFFCLAAHWKLRDEAARGLIGGISNASISRLQPSPGKAANAQQLQPDKLTSATPPLSL